MALRALLFSSDGDSTSALCHVLTKLGIEAEICAEMLVAVEHLTKGGYDAVVVDWDHQSDAIFLLKTVRELKANPQALSLALVQNDADLALALQSGANSVIRKPIDEPHAHDTLSTAQDLILSWRAEHKEKEIRLAAAKDAAAQDLGHSGEEEVAPTKTGFLPQAAPRSALEAEEIAREKGAPAEASVEEEAQPEELPPPVQVSAPISARTWQEMQEAKAAVAPPPKPKQDLFEEVLSPEPRSQDVGGIFSSYPENPETDDLASAPRRKSYGIVAVAAVLLISGGLYAWAPGHPGLLRLIWSLHTTITGETAAGGSAPVRPAPSPEPVIQPVAQPAAEKPADAAVPETVPASGSDDPSQIHVIETKAIPPAGAQQPPNPEAPPDLSTGQTPPDTAPPADAPAQVAPPADAPAQPAPQTQPAPAAIPPADSLAQGPPAQPPAALPQPAPAPATSALAPHPAPVPANEAPTEGRVIIPDSLKTRPFPAPPGSLEPVVVPEETSRRLLLQSVDPVYPPQAIQQKMQGPVVLQAWVGKDGSVRDLKLVRGYFALGRAAVDAVRQWRFRPYSLNGQPTDFQTYITINFKLPS